MFNRPVSSAIPILLGVIFCSTGTEAAQQNNFDPSQQMSQVIQIVNQSSPIFTMIPTNKINEAAQGSTTSFLVSSPVLEHLTTQTAANGDQTRTFWVIDTDTGSSGPTATIESTTTVSPPASPSGPTTLITSTTTSASAAAAAAAIATGASTSPIQPDRSSKLPLIIGISAPAAAGILIAVLWWCIRRRRSKVKEANARAERNNTVELPNRVSSGLDKPPAPRTSGTGLEERKGKAKQAPLTLTTKLSNIDKNYYPISPEEAGASPEYYSSSPAPATSTASRSPPPKYASPVTSMRSTPPRPPRPQSIGQTTLGGLRDRFDASTISESHSGAPPFSAGRTPFSVLGTDRMPTPDPYRTYTPDLRTRGSDYGNRSDHSRNNSEPCATGSGYNRPRDDGRSITPRPLNVVKRSASDNFYETSRAPSTHYGPQSIIDDYAERQTIPDSVFDDARRHSDQGKAYAYLEGRERQVHSPPPMLRQMFAPSEFGSSVYTSDTYGVPYSDNQLITEDMRRRRRERLEREEQLEQERQAEWKRLQENK